MTTPKHELFSVHIVSRDNGQRQGFRTLGEQRNGWKGRRDDQGLGQGGS